MPRYFMPSRLAKRDHLLYVRLEDDGRTTCFYRDGGAEENRAFTSAWIFKRVSEGAWIEMNDPPLFATDSAAVSEIDKALSGIGEHDYEWQHATICKIVAQLLHGLGYHKTAETIS